MNKQKVQTWIIFTSLSSLPLCPLCHPLFYRHPLALTLLLFLLDSKERLNCVLTFQNLTRFTFSFFGCFRGHSDFGEYSTAVSVFRDWSQTNSLMLTFLRQSQYLLGHQNKTAKFSENKTFNEAALMFISSWWHKSCYWSQVAAVCILVLLDLLPDPLVVLPHVGVHAGDPLGGAAHAPAHHPGQTPGPFLRLTHQGAPGVSLTRVLKKIFVKKC